MTLNSNIVVSKNCLLLVLETVYTMSNMYKVYGIVVGPLGSSFFFLPRPRGEHGNKKINRYVYTMSNMYKVYGIVVGPLGSSFFFLPRPRGEHGNKKINRYEEEGFPVSLCSYLHLQTLTDPESAPAPPQPKEEEEGAWTCLHRFLLRKEVLNAQNDSE
ncbi:hypothetical protein NDU88_007716 [Pleurodeles waltl]|uniref:Uncharacterized protein n=1 Tax=Pleurodeles waltl TaxID=8319 RepID=A0AAV7STA8_PLEWA|nr:hypothetical protein NDU88_007716 [Pleurodeles waltl]